MTPVQAALFVGLIPALSAAVVVFLSRLIGRRRGGGEQTGLALAIGVGMIVAHLGVAWPNWPPVDVTDRLPFLETLALMLALLEVTRPTPGWARWENRVLLAVLTLGAILEPILQITLAEPGGAQWVLIVLALWLACWANGEALAARLPATTLLPAWALTVAAAGVALLLTGSAIMGLIGLATASALAGAWVGSLRMIGALTLARGVLPTMVTGIGGLLLTGYVYSSLPSRVALLLLLAPLAGWIGVMGPLRRRGGWISMLALVLATLLPAGIAVGLAYASMDPEGY